MKKYLLPLSTILAFLLPVSLQAKQGIIKLTSVEMTEDGDGVTKQYKSDDVIRVTYSYGESVLDSDYLYSLHLDVVEDYSVAIPVDVLETGFDVGGDMDETVRKFKIPKQKIMEGCNFEGKADVRLTDMVIWVPEHASEYVYSAKVKEVIWASPPILLCQNND